MKENLQVTTEICKDTTQLYTDKIRQFVFHEQTQDTSHDYFFPGLPEDSASSFALVISTPSSRTPMTTCESQCSQGKIMALVAFIWCSFLCPHKRIYISLKTA